MEISCIICSRNDELFENIKRNINATIGVGHEIVVVDNSSGDKSIFSAYNEGVRRSHGDILCFVHEDVIFKQDKWGEVIRRHFADSTVGLVGLAGSHSLSSSPLYWTEMPFISEHNLSNGERCFHWWDSSRHLVDVAVCDGLCLFVRKSLFRSISFDEVNFSGFHLYDMDICMQVHKSGFRVCVCDDLLVNHLFSGGASLDVFDANMHIFCRKWKDSLPISRGIEMIPEYVQERLEFLCAKAYDSRKARRSMAFRLGSVLLKPFRLLKSR